MPAFSEKLLLLILCCFSISVYGFTQRAITVPASNGSFSITVSDAVTNAPQPDISVEIYDSSVALIRTVVSDANGNIDSGPLPAGDYFIKSLATDNYVSKVYPAVQCITECDAAAGWSVTVRDNLTLFLFDAFKLESGGLISGTVTDDDSGEPLQGVQLQVYDTSGTQIGSAVTDASGRYLLRPNFLDQTVLPDGEYHVVTFNTPGYFDESYDNIRFDINEYPHDFSASTPVVVSNNQITTGIDLSLKKGGRIAGTITDADNGAPLQDISVTIVNEYGSIVADGWSDAAGSYITYEPLIAGTYYVYTGNRSGYINQRYGGDRCTSQCGDTLGSPVIVKASMTIDGIDFSLPKGGQIAGAITDAITGQPLQSISLSVYDGSGTFVSNGWTDAAGHYLTKTGLPSGDYYIKTYNISGYINERFEDQICNELYCDTTSGTAVNVTEGQITTGIDFDLSPGARISGTVTDNLGGFPIDGVTVYTYDDSGTLLDISLASSGQYISDRGLIPGNYYLHTENNLGYINQRYNGQPLASPGSIIDSTPIAVSGTNTITDVDFALVKGGRISGRVTDVVTGQPFTEIQPWIQIYDSEGDLVSRAIVDDNGDYRSGAALPSGEYYVRAYDMARNLASQLYADKNFSGECVEWQRCDVSGGTLVTVRPDSDTVNIDFFIVSK